MMTSKKKLKLHMSKRVMTRLSLLKPHVVPLRAPRLVTKENLKQHIAHFIETCSQVGIESDLLVKQFVQSFQGNAFD
ncbi:hypothetical protein PVL29_022992 [Vitis rotundifolia]|uniref:Uncharacterized protein n=1 Tax=Vitis rotundifolia TaxID=103349 RepID=A0AA38YXB4_VITRO|nr:hypothetical protein PVL29_022992 [Vitis rotundifolia]